MGSTIIDVAKKCGYSKATVSRAYAEPDRVSEKAKLKIYAAAKSLNYTPNAIARAMVRQQTENIAFIIHEKQSPAVLNPFYSPILEAIMRECTRRGYSVFVITNQDMQLPNGDLYIKKQMDGVIFAGEANPQAIKQLQEQNIPVVLLNNYQDLPNLLCVVADHYQGAIYAVNHLYDRGHRKIGLLAGRFSPQIREARYNGYFDALAQHGLRVDSRWIQNIDPSLEAGEEAMARLLALPERPSAVFCTNDTVAAGAIKAVLRAGRRLPEDMAIVGYDDNYISRIVEPELTTIRVDAAKMGRIAAQKLFDLIARKPMDEHIIQLPTQLVVRGTT
ncbi:LacI family DNA-binding transcriptional regulator [Oscillibacter sp.]|uniref:LacI family DNA-binding transcriptional regulator n=1 Tax=Oscillibacter sp. TaxID=1945593 RepID=UPI002D7E1C37|nr:LacI family DNA-binding transcriptional regulator [Oscillibacter sp.]